MRLSLILLLLAGAARADVPSTVPSLRSEVRKVMDAQVAAWNKKDLDGYMAGYWKSPQLTFYGGKQITGGWQETLDRYRKKYRADNMGTLTFEELSIEPLGDTAALARGRWKLQFSDGKSAEGLFTVIFRKLPEGWKIIHDHSC
jgi:beta-aspartyl-peptidase (threonine type)